MKLMAEMQKKRNTVKVILLVGFSLAILSIGPLIKAAATEKTVIVPFVFEKIPDAMLMAGQSAEAISITVSGLKDDISSIKPFVFPVDLSSAVLGENTIVPDIRQLKLSGTIKIEGYLPKTITIFLENKASKTVPIIVKTKGSPAQGYVVTEAFVTPSEITLSGTQSFVDSISKCYIKPVDISGLKDSIKKEAVPDIGLTKGASVLPNPVMAEIRLSEKKLSKKIRQIPVYGDNSLKKIRVQPAFIDIDVSGSLMALDSLDPEKDIRVAIDLQGLPTGVYVRRASISLPVELMLDNVEPKIFTITISEIGTKNK
jgi:hypothetical protein